MQRGAMRRARRVVSHQLTTVKGAKGMLEVTIEGVTFTVDRYGYVVGRPQTEDEEQAARRLIQWASDRQHGLTLRTVQGVLCIHYSIALRGDSAMPAARSVRQEANGDILFA